ncbi:MAG: EutP/PduV family microcompartment system protein [Dehalobacterium sp.]
MRLMIIGPSGAGKTTLSRALTGSKGKVQKTQMIDFVDRYIDTPGEYLEIPRFYKALFVTSQQADIVIMVVPADKYRIYIPEGLAQAFPRPVIGVINKIDLAGADIHAAAGVLNRTGVKEPYFHILASTGQGLSRLKSYLESLDPKSTNEGLRG